MLTIVILLLIGSYVGPALNLFNNHRSANALMSDLHRQQRQNARLKKSIRHISTDNLLTREARRQGMIMTGEQAIVVDGLRRR